MAFRCNLGLRVLYNIAETREVVIARVITKIGKTMETLCFLRLLFRPAYNDSAV